MTFEPHGRGRILRVTGPLVEAEYIGGTAMSDLVALGDAGLPGEVVAIRDRVVTVQAYEYTGGPAPGAPVRPLGRPLSAPLGPGLLGGIFDGLLRPPAAAGAWLEQALARVDLALEQSEHEDAVRRRWAARALADDT
ncbi:MULTISPECIES: hypothetical protein [unclassified Streptomyces]|uniref:hypothetical protein n=1 Tax=unclassified Streptomyces TaxID=2593676 RepID=UPI002E1B7F10|nr:MULTISPECIES: hypothetical protein [unclassified Streptomyces]